MGIEVARPESFLKNGVLTTANKATVCVNCLVVLRFDHATTAFRGLNQLEYKQSNSQLLQRSHWLMRRADGSLRDNDSKSHYTSSGYKTDDMRILSVLISPTKPWFNIYSDRKWKRLSNNRIDNKGGRFSIAWDQLYNKMTKSYKKDKYEEMLCGPFALLFALIELESDRVNPETPEKVQEFFDKVWENIRNAQEKHDPILRNVICKIKQKNKNNVGTFPLGLVKTINKSVLCEGFTARIEIRREALKHFPILQNCVEPWGAKLVDEFTNPKEYERALDWIVFRRKPNDYNKETRMVKRL